LIASLSSWSKHRTARSKSGSLRRLKTMKWVETVTDEKLKRNKIIAIRLKLIGMISGLGV